MQSQNDHLQLQVVRIDPQCIRPYIKRKHGRNAESEVIPRKTQLKIIRLDQQVINSSSAKVVNLSFAQQQLPPFKRTNRKVSKRGLGTEQRKNTSHQRQVPRHRYQDIMKDNLDYFCKNTMQIGPCIKSIIAQTELNDLYARRRLINIQKLAFPRSNPKKQGSVKQKLRTLMNKTPRTYSKEDQYNDLQKRKKSMAEKTLEIGGEQVGFRTFKRISETQPFIQSLICEKQEPKPQYKKEVSNLIPIRKPAAKKDYFVFGLADRTNSSQNKIEFYRDLLWKINYSNGLYVCTPDSLPQPYKFFIGEGNNSNLIRSIMRRRFWWAQASSKNQEGIHFLWTQLKVNSFFTSQEKGAMPEYFIAERTRSQSCFEMGAKSCNEDHNRKIFGRLDYKIWLRHMLKNQKTEKKISENTYQRRVKMYEKKKITKIDSSQLLRMHNHLEQNFYIGNKKALFYNFKRYLQIKGQDPFSVLPLTFHIKKGVDDPQYLRFLEYYQMLEQQKLEKRNVRNIWIVKPGQNTNRGNGITVCYGLDDIKLRLKGRQRNGNGKLRTFILQKYIQNPLLYHKRKFDIRHFILITCINGSFKGYWFEEGYVRTSSAEFNIKSNRDPSIHLTNDAIQKQTSEYGKYEKGNKISYAELQKYLDSSFPGKKYDFFEGALPKMKSITTEALKATYFLLDGNRRTNNFQLLGLDFMLDEDFQPWLIEVNTNPCLELCCPLMRKIIPGVIENTFKLTLDPLFPPPQIWPNNRKPFFGEDALSQNRYEIIFDESSQGKEVEKLFQGHQKIDAGLGKVEQDEQTFDNEGDLEWQAQ